MRSAWRPAAWCFQSFGHACGRSARPSTQHSGVPSRSTGSGVEAVKSVPIPTTSEGAMPAACTAAGTAVRRTPTQSPGSCRAHWGGSDAPEEASVRSITPCGNSYTADPSSAPSETRTTTARPESVPKSTPMTQASAAIAVPPARCAVLADDDLGQLLDRRLGRRPVEHDLPVAQQVDAVTRLKDVDVVVQDHDHRDVPALAQARDEVEDDRAFLDAHRREWLVEQQDARLRVQRAGDRDRLALAAGQAQHRRVDRGDVHADVADVLLGFLAHAAVVEQPERKRVEQLPVEKHVVEDAQLVDQREVLVNGVDPLRARVGYGVQLDRLAVEHDRAGVGLVEAAEDLHQRRLARAVVAQQAEDLALLEAQVDLAQRRDRAEALGHVLDSHDLGPRVHHSLPRARTRL